MNKRTGRGDMASYLADYTEGRDNNFNLVRFIAAAMVLLSHSYFLTGVHEDPLQRVIGLSFGNLAVNIFFITSGFLVTGSLLTRKNVFEFIWARMLRIYPALVVSVILCVFGVGLFFTSLPAGTYLSDTSVYRFLFNNSMLIIGPINHNLPGVFENTPWKYAVNGSLWTLRWEIKMYAILAVCGVFAFRMRTAIGVEHIKTLFVAIGLLSTVAYLANHVLSFSKSRDAVESLHFLSMFFIGSSCYVLKNRVLLSHWMFFIIMLALIAFAGTGAAYFIVCNVLLAYAVLYISFVPSGRIRAFNRIGDYSYGMYIYAFPVQQSLAASIPGIGVKAMFFSSFAITFLFAFLSWHIIEKQMLKKKAGYVRVQGVLSRMRFAKQSV